MDGDTLQVLLVEFSGYYTVEVFDETGECSVMSDNGVQYGSVENNQEEGAMMLYPNPSNTLIYLKSLADLNKTYFVELYDNLGRLVLTSDNQSVESDVLPINIGALKPSIYSVVVRYTDGRVWNQTLIKK